MTSMMVKASLETIYMVVASSFFAFLIGFPLGIILVTSQETGLRPSPILNKVLGSIINILRSIPFLILMIIVFPLSKLIVGSKFGTSATIVPLSVSAVPFVARIIEGNLNEVDKGVIELSQSMGASLFQIVGKVMIPEAFPSIINSITITIINLIGYSAMAGALGGGGLGDVAIRFGHHKWDNKTMFVSVFLIVILVQLVQFLGSYLAKKVDKRKL